MRFPTYVMSCIRLSDHTRTVTTGTSSNAAGHMHAWTPAEAESPRKVSRHEAAFDVWTGMACLHDVSMAVHMLPGHGLAYIAMQQGAAAC